MAYYRCGGGVPSSVKTLPTYKTASGSVATFETDMTENLISCVCEIPSGGASAVNVTRTGKNFWDNNKAVADSNISSVYISDEWLNFTTGQYRLLYNFTTTDRMTFSAIVKNKEASSNTVSIQARYSDNTNETIATITLNDQNEHTISGTTASGKTLVGFRTGWTDARQACMKNIQLEFGTSATTYEPFGDTFTVNLGSTYTGTVDVITGKITDSADNVYYSQNTVEIPTTNGTNNVYADTGDISEAKYILSVGEALRQS